MMDKMKMEEKYVGKAVRIICMEGEPQYTGRVGEVRCVDDMGQLHGSWGGCALIPGTDSFKILN